MNSIKSAEIIIKAYKDGIPTTIRINLKSKHILEKLKGYQGYDAVGCIVNKRDTVEAESEAAKNGAMEFIKTLNG